ncbi:MAG: hypothetical protein ACTTJ0_00060 [Porphyromonas endodontalis]
MAQPHLGMQRGWSFLLPPPSLYASRERAGYSEAIILLLTL